MLIRLLTIILLASMGTDQYRLRFVLTEDQEEADHVAADCERGSTATALALASSGQTVRIPAGSCTWTSGVTIPAGVTLKGTGTPTSDPDEVGASATCQQTQITLDNSSSTVIGFTMAATYGDTRPRLSCMEILYATSSRAVGIEANGTCTASGCPELRWDNLTFTNWAGHSTVPSNSFGINALNGFFGVIDHNYVEGNGAAFLELVEVGLTAYLGVGAFGDNDWAQPENFGSAGFIFLENNLLENGVGLTENETTVVPAGGGRIVARKNTFNQRGNLNGALNWHGTESNGRPRAVHAFEFYQNTFTCAPGQTCGTVVGPRDGTGLMWGNTVNNISSNMSKFFGAVNYRSEGPGGGATWDSCDGSADYDTNDGVVYFEGTVASGGGDATYTVDETGVGDPAWDVNEWATVGSAYSVHNVTKGKGHIITANTSNTLTILNTGAPGAFYDADGDSIQILRATACIDQPGRGAGQLYSGNPASPASAATQALVPIYTLMTTLNGTAFIFGTQGVTVTPVGHFLRNRDYYMENLNQTAQTSASAPFDGTTSIGIGHGTIARRPATCTTGVAYWATDEGEWDSTNGATADGKMYICTATNTWTARYGGATSNTSGTPYTYPHPLVQ